MIRLLQGLIFLTETHKSAVVFPQTNREFSSNFYNSLMISSIVGVWFPQALQSTQWFLIFFLSSVWLVKAESPWRVPVFVLWHQREGSKDCRILFHAELNPVFFLYTHGLPHSPVWWDFRVWTLFPLLSVKMRKKIMWNKALGMRHRLDTEEFTFLKRKSLLILTFPFPLFYLLFPKLLEGHHSV